jgi:hypothetical protein
MMKTIAYLTLVGGLALACAAPAFADPIGDGEGGGGVSESFTLPPLGPDVTDYINSLPPDSGDRATAVFYDPTGYMPTLDDGLGDLQISWSDTSGLTTGAYDQYWLTHTAPPSPPQQNLSHNPLFHNPLRFNPPTGNLGESDAAGEGYMFSVTARNIRFVQLVPEPGSLLLIGVGMAALLLARRRGARQSC